MRRRRRQPTSGELKREVNYRDLKNPFPPMEIFSADEIIAIHEAAVTVLEDLGIAVLLPEARKIYRSGGAIVEDEVVRIGRDMIEAALASAPRAIHCRAGATHRDVTLELGTLVFQPGAGCPHATDLTRGRRPGTAADYRELITLTQAFDVLHMLPPLVEAQDVPTHLRHYAFLDAELSLSDKFPFVFSRGTPQVQDAFEMIRLGRGLSDAEFAADTWCYTIINTNSPRTIDVAMAQGLIDFARAGQVSIVTPFTLMGAMAPITVAGAITLSHAEALAAIVLTQLVRPGAPVCYGTFTSNVDMKSGSPAFGTPAHFQASLAAGQLARMIGLPWRSATGTASNAPDVQGANETQLGLWGCLLAGSTVVLHAAGWLEGGLTISYEKLITDVEVLQIVAELCAGAKAGPAEIGLDALAEVAPSGHFFSAGQTMARYKTEFYEPLVAEMKTFGTWEHDGARDTTTRATAIWQELLADPPKPEVDSTRVAAMREFAQRRKEAGGALPES